MKHQLTILFACLFFSMLLSFQSNAQIYYIDQSAGNDANSGTSITLPWKNISKINSLTLSAGSRVFLKAGCVWNNQQLKFNGSGNSTSPIIITSYGSGNKPILNGNGLTGQGVIYLYNQQYIEISNLEITNAPNGPINSDFFVGINDGNTNNNPLGADRRGVMVAIDNFGTASHIYFKNLNIHHIKGQLGSGSNSVNGAIPKRTGGMFFTVLGNSESSSSKSRFHDVLIDSCNINYCENIGIALDNEWNTYYPGGQNSSVSADRTEYTNWYNRRFSNLKISNNVIHHIGKNAMIIRCTDSTGLIERNVCYETALGTTGNTMFTARAKGTVFQYNEGYYNRATTQNIDPGNIDGSMYDPDFGSVGIIFQYSYSHDNSQGIYWGCNTRSQSNTSSNIADPGDSACTLRYCISQNDKGDLVYFNYPSSGNHIYNNVFYIKSGLSPNIIHENSSNNHKYDFYNNIIYNLSSSSSGADYAFGSGSAIQTKVFSNNVFYGNHPSGEPTDPSKLTSNPNFVSPGAASIGIYTTMGYKLNYGSPALHNGKIIVNNGGLDYYGNAVSASVSPNRGCYEGAGIGAPVTNLPVITSFTPSTSGTGSTVTISGLHLIGATSVSFGGTPATSFTVINDSTILAVVGNGTTGYIIINNNAGADTSATIFNFCPSPAAPRSNGVSICSGTSTSLTATGTGILSWYNATSGGIRLATGNIFTTPVLTATTTYYVQDSTCSISASRTPVSVAVNQLITPIFNQVAAICSGGSFNLPTTSNNTITGTWSPAINNQTTTTYTFTPNAGQCAGSTTMTVLIKSPTSSITNAVVCVSQLPYLWNGLSLTASGTYSKVFTGGNTVGCDSTALLNLSVNATPVNPTFTQIQSICSGGTIILPTSSNNGVSGSWSPLINNQQTTNYTFTPNSGQCALTTTLTVVVKPNSPVTDTFVNTNTAFVWHGTTYNTSGIYTWTGINNVGCDSIVILHLEIQTLRFIYPNPTNGDLHINQNALENINGKKIKITVYDALGRKVFVQDLKTEVTDDNIISLKSFSNGIYMINIKSEDNNIKITEKVFKTN